MKPVRLGPISYFSTGWPERMYGTPLTRDANRPGVSRQYQPFDCGGRFNKAIASTDFANPSESTEPVSVPTEATHLTMDGVAASRPVDQELLVPINRSINSNVVHDILSFLQKPRMVSRATWTPALANGNALIAPFESFGAYFNTLQPAFRRKLDGFAGIKYTTNIKVIINSTPFQQGKLRLVYYPTGQRCRDKFNAHVQNRISISQMPGAEVTTMDSVLEISIPFLSYQRFKDLTAAGGVDPLLIALYNFSALQNGANATTPNATVSIWMWLSDVELFGSTTVEAQSKMARVKRGRHAAAEEERPLSSWLSATSKLAGSLSDVPVLSSIAGPTAVWLKNASGLAHAFGYSRPIDGQPTRAMAPHYHNGITNSDGLNVSSVLALNRDASARIISDYSPSGQDEMSINFIKRQWSFVGEFPFQTSQSSGQLLFSQLLGLNMGGSATGLYGQSVSPIEFLGRLCRHYRGGIEICYKFIKTGFHSGSLVFSYANGSTPLSPTLEQTDTLHRTVVDLQDGDSVCLSYPFIRERDWLNTNEFYGRHYVHVLNSLVAPETVPQFIIAQVYVRGMHDMEFSSWNHQNPQIPQITTPFEAQMGEIEMQGGDLENNDEIVCEPIGGLLVEPMPNGLQMMDVTSESCNSLLQFLKASVPIRIADARVVSGLFSVSFNPSAWTVRGVNTAGTVFTAPPFTTSSMAAIKSCYAYQRGGYELNILPSIRTTGEKAGSLMASSDYFFGGANVCELEFVTTPAGTSYDPASIPQLQSAQRNFGPVASNHPLNGLSVTLPYKSTYRVNPIVPAIIGTNYGDDQYRARFNVVCTQGETLRLRPAEDFQLLYWVGVPPLVQL